MHRLPYYCLESLLAALETFRVLSHAISSSLIA